jgi:hypothetical protein
VLHQEPAAVHEGQLQLAEGRVGEKLDARVNLCHFHLLEDIAEVFVLAQVEVGGEQKPDGQADERK